MNNSATSPDRFYLTTPIYYVNGAPHIGHAYTSIAADVMARFKRLDGYDVFFLTGTDEHGQKVQQTARARGVAPQAFADEVSAEFRALLPRLEISNDDFIRTTEERHKRVVRDILQRLFDKGDIYKGEYRGFYSTRQEQFLQGKDRNPDGTWPERPLAIEQGELALDSIGFRAPLTALYRTTRLARASV